ncbi:hypothetical protein [Streptosporangium sp. 'caverna']|uniref:hypothetical protein n=1 Tax=Streptosporangium sp. 'caverna' TaxID=2202249 RepID=UPI000D7D3CB2|nr:hypothetical protein [Streptosporangium sp. 'caverna']AWS43665.1 hypothetical protein DKM19_22165 [Streptosporangium sp. 'caverna']
MPFEQRLAGVAEPIRSRRVVALIDFLTDITKWGWAEAPARDAENRGWIAEAERHRALPTRLDTLISEAQAG